MLPPDMIVESCSKVLTSNLAVISLLLKYYVMVLQIRLYLWKTATTTLSVLTPVNAGKLSAHVVVDSHIMLLLLHHVTISITVISLLLFITVRDRILLEMVDESAK